MLLFEAAHEIEERLKIVDYKEQIPEYYEALEIALKSIEAQSRLELLLNDFNAENEAIHASDRYSRALVLEFLNCCRFDYVEEEYYEDEG